jgi:hypothetical protein
MCSCRHCPTHQKITYIFYFYFYFYLRFCYDPNQVPGCINSKLYDYQRDGVRFLYTLYRKNKGGILGDDMGAHRWHKHQSILYILFTIINIHYLYLNII